MNSDEKVDHFIFGFLVGVIVGFGALGVVIIFSWIFFLGEIQDHII